MGAVVSVQGKFSRLRVRMVFGKGGLGYCTMRQLGLGFGGCEVVPDILVFAAQVLALIGRSQVPRGSLSRGMIVFAVECHNQ